MSAFAWNAYNAGMDVALLPSNATPIERAFDALWADRWARLPVKAIAAARFDQTCPAEWLGYLAAERSVDEYSSFWPLDQRRAVVNDSFRFHQRKGTRAALDRALGPLSYTPKVIEWFEVTPHREPYTFRLQVRLGASGSWVDAQRVEVVRRVNAAKNAHTLLQQIDLLADLPTPVFVGMSFHSRVLRRTPVPPVVIPEPEPLVTSVTTPLRIGMSFHSQIIIRARTA